MYAMILDVLVWVIATIKLFAHDTTFGNVAEGLTLW